MPALIRILAEGQHVPVMDVRGHWAGTCSAEPHGGFYVVEHASNLEWIALDARPCNAYRRERWPDRALPRCNTEASASVGSPALSHPGGSFNVSHR